ncbi:MAG: FG-GAP repeat-containing protein, partial [bacterium]
PGIVVGSMNVTDAVAAEAQGDALTAYNTLAGSRCNNDLTGQDLGGLTLVPGTYCFSSSAQLTGELTLNALGSDSSVFVFQIGSTLTTASGSSVTLINGGSGCNVFWQVGTSATLGTTTEFVGNVLASASITVNTGASVSGRLLALNGALTLDTNSVTIPPECQCVVSYGAGCAGTGGFVPDLSLGCPIPGVPVTLEMEQGLGGSVAFLLVGNPVDLSMPCGCGLLVQPGPVVLVLPVVGSGAGNGSLAFTCMVPASSPSGTISVQVVVLDNGVPCGFSSTNALQVTIW